MIVEVILILFLVYLAHFLITTNIMRRSLPPGPFPYPLVGNFPEFLRYPKKPFYCLAEKYGDIFTLVFPHGLKTVVLNTATLARQARLTTQDSLAGKSSIALYPWNEILGRDVITADYSPEFIFRRKVFTAAVHLHGTGIDQRAKLAEHAIGIVIREIDNKEREPFSPNILFESAILVQLWEWVSGKKVTMNDSIIKRLRRFNEINARQETINNLSQVIPFFKYLPNLVKLEINEGKEIRNQIFPQEYIAHKETYCTGIIRDLTDNFISCYEREMAKEAKKQIDKMEDVVGLMVDVIFAGSITTSLSMNWLVLYMTLNPDIQEKLHKEITTVLGDDRLPSWKYAKDMHYLQASLCETQRASGLSPMILTTAIRETKIAEYRIPEGSFVAVNLDKIHHDPNEWPEPEKFKPERFLDSDGIFVGWNKLHSFLPFGAGPRKCAGETLAKIMLSTFTVALFYRYKFEFPERGKIPSIEDVEPGVSKRPRDYKIIAKKRKD